MPRRAFPVITALSNTTAEGTPSRLSSQQGQSSRDLEREPNKKGNVQSSACHQRFPTQPQAPHGEGTTRGGSDPSPPHFQNFSLAGPGRAGPAGPEGLCCPRVGAGGAGGGLEGSRGGSWGLLWIPGAGGQCRGQEGAAGDRRDVSGSQGQEQGAGWREGEPGCWG